MGFRKEITMDVEIIDKRLVVLIVSVNRLIYIKSLNDFRDFFYS